MKTLLPFAAICALLLPAAYAAAKTVEDAEIVSSNAISTMYNANGSVKINKTGEINGGTYFQSLFNGKFDDYVYNNTANTYIVINLDETFSDGCYVTKVKIGHAGNAQYSLYCSEDGANWTAIVEKTTTAQIESYTLNVVAKKVKYVFDTIKSWTPSLGEIEVWGLNPNDMDCLHEAKYLSEWTPIPGSSTCTERGFESATCSNCGATLTRECDELPPLGHDYEFILESPGTGLNFGVGKISCRRHDLEIDCTEGPVDLMPFGGAKTDGVIHFTDVSTSSIGNEDWGVRVNLLFDDDWSMGWTKYWYAATKATSEYAQYEFDTAIDLTSVEVSVPNRTHNLFFYSVQDGKEVLIGAQAFERDDSIPDQENGTPNALPKTTVEFRGVTLQTLRIKSDDANNALTICELHPWGTVEGAGKTAAVRTRIIID